MSLATTTVFLYVGFDTQRRAVHGEWPENPGGFTGLLDWLEQMATHLERQYDAEFAALDLPIVFDYEITEELGAWLFTNPQATEVEFANVARKLVRACQGDSL